MFLGRLFILLFCFKWGLGLQKKLCYNDEECFMNAVIDRVYPMLVTGRPGVDTSDPLRLDAFIADLPSLRYALYNASLTGLMDCEFIQLDNKVLSVYTVFDYVLSCPVLTIQGEYDLNGIIDSEPLEGKGQCKIIYKDYQLAFNGKREQVKDSKGRLHINILENKVTTNLKGEVKDIEYRNLIKNQRSCHDRVKAIEKFTRDVTIDVFMNKFMQHMKKFYQQVPVDQLHFKYVR